MNDISSIISRYSKDLCKCVSGTYNIERWYRETKVVNENGEPLNISDLEDNYRTVEAETSVRPYTDWDKGVQLLSHGFKDLFKTAR